jgi:hypothetical protein
MRLFLVGGVATGIGLTLLGISILLSDMTVAFQAYLGCIVCAIIVIFCAVINSLTTWAGLVHPDDRLWSNILAYLLALFAILTLGRFVPIVSAILLVASDWLFRILFNTGTMLILALILLFALVGLSGRFQLREVLEGTDSEGRTKEISARLILFSLLVGALMVLVQTGLEVLNYYLYTLFGLPHSYYYVAIGIGAVATILVVLLGVILRSKYEKVK